MKKANLFYLFIILTILITRFMVSLIPDVDLTAFGFVIHHFWIGILLVVVGRVIPNGVSYFKVLLFGVGFGLIIDQLVFTLLGAGGDLEYWAVSSLVGVIVILIGFYFIREKVLKLVLRGC